ncbi:hypothetical protein BY458DRAFT_513438 [Sporodiniella umbellata]|nr:hypothetical protein BY458DRAFT_513438 [Sporodiniella umbellata]
MHKNNKIIEKPKRKQVKNACVNCQKACKKCDDGRPCARCMKLGLAATCRDSDRKERKKGMKRGPYKKRQTQAVVYPALVHPEPWPSVPITTTAIPTQMQWTDLIGHYPISPASSFTDETLHTLWEAEKILARPLEQQCYELDLLQEPHVWYPVQSPVIEYRPSFPFVPYTV